MLKFSCLKKGLPLFFVLLSTVIYAQPSKKVKVKPKVSDLYFALCDYEESIGEALFEALNNGSLPAYTDAGLKHRMSQNLLPTSVFVYRNVKVSNPLNPAEIIDSLFKIQLQPHLVKMHAAKQFIRLEVDDTFSYYLNRKECEKKLSAGEISMLAFCEAKMSGKFDRDSFRNFAKAWYPNVKDTLYKWGRHDILRAYRFDSLRSFYSKDQLWELDSMILQSGQAKIVPEEDITEFAVYMIFEVKGNGNYAVSVSSIAPMYVPLFSGFMLPPNPLFHLRFNDVLAKFSASDQFLLGAMTDHALLMTLYPSRYGSEQDFESH